MPSLLPLHYIRSPLSLWSKIEGKFPILRTGGGNVLLVHVRKIWPRLFDRLCGRPLHFIDPTFAEPSPSLLDSWPLCAVKRIASASGAEGYRACRLGCGPETMVDSDVSLRRQRGMLAPLSLLPAEELLRY